jgi:hypothetical protein
VDKRSCIVVTISACLIALSLPVLVLAFRWFVYSSLALESLFTSGTILYMAAKIYPSV